MALCAYARAEPQDTWALDVQRALLQRSEYRLLDRLNAERGWDLEWLNGADGRAVVGALADAHGVRMACGQRIASNACAGGADHGEEQSLALYIRQDGTWQEFVSDPQALERLEAPEEQAKTAGAIRDRLRDSTSYGRQLRALWDAGTDDPAAVGPRAVRDLVRRAQDAAAAQDWTLAANLLITAHKRGARDPRLLYNAGLAQAKLGHDAAAIAWFRAYLAASPKAPDAVQVRKSADALLQRLRKRADLLFDEAEDAAGRINGEVVAWAVLANVKADLGDLSSARKYLRRIESASTRAEKDASATGYYLAWASESGERKALEAAAREITDAKARDKALGEQAAAHTRARDVLGAVDTARLMGDEAQRADVLAHPPAQPPGVFSDADLVDLWAQRARWLSHPDDLSNLSDHWVSQARAASSPSDMALYLGRAAWTARRGLIELSFTDARAKRLRQAGERAMKFQQALAARDAKAIASLLNDAPWLVDARGSDGLSALHRAAYLGDAAQARQLVDAGAGLDMLSVEGLTPLHFAARSPAGARDVMQVLLESGASADRQSPQGRTPLHFALLELSGDPLRSAVEMLVASGADPYQPDDYGISAYELAERKDATLLALLEPMVEPAPPAEAATRAFEYRGETVELPEDALFELSGLVADATAGEDEFGPLVKITLTQEGADRFGDFSGRMIGREVGILIGGQLVQTAMLRQAIPGGTIQISKPGSPDQAAALVRSLRTATAR
jgi:hypothetical protein